MAKSETKISIKKVLFLLIFVIAIAFGLYLIVNLLFIKEEKYPLIYKSSDNKLMMLKSSDEVNNSIVLSTKDGPGYVLYANNDSNYFLYKKGTDLYLYNVKKEKETKVVENVSAYTFNTNDSYIIALSDVGILYSYDYNELNIIDTEVDNNFMFSEKYVVYEKLDGKLKVSKLSGKNKNIIDKEVADFTFTDSNDYVMYVNNKDELISYDISDNKKEKLIDKVDYYYCDSEDCESLYYIINKNDYSEIHYYDGEDSVVVKKANDIEAVDVDKQILLYTLKDSDKLYIKVEDGESSLVDDTYGSVGYAKIYDGKEIYFVNSKKELIYTKVSDIKTKKTLIKDVRSTFLDSKKGYYIFGDVGDDYKGNIYSLEDGKAKKIAKNIYLSNSSFLIAKDGISLYYLKDYEFNSGILNVYDGKETKTIAKNVYSFQFVDKDLLYYITDYDSSNIKGTLYRYKDSKKEKVSSKVQDVAKIKVSSFEK